jgi:hypothetical protein
MEYWSDGKTTRREAPGLHVFSNTPILQYSMNGYNGLVEAPSIL